MTAKETSLYRSHPNCGAVFAFESDARRVDTIYRALSDAKTWGEFRQMLPEGEWASIRRMVGRIPKDTASFDGYDAIPQASDGDYPEWLQQRLGDVLPAAILGRFAKPQSSAINGFYWHIDWEKAEEVAAALRGLGFDVQAASGLEFF